MYSFFTPTTGLVGGTLIGLSAGTLLIFNGDILGASGILSTSVLDLEKTMKDRTQFWKLITLSSFSLTAALVFGPDYISDARSADPSDIVPIPSAVALTIAGLLVGFGTKLGNGCTSGHGVCGLGRFSKRSLVAVATFMTTSIGTQYLLKPTAAWAEHTSFMRADKSPEVNSVLGGLLVTLPLCLAAVAGALMSRKKEKVEEPQGTEKLGPAAVSGMIFAAGLAISQMVVQSKLFGFLDVSGVFNGQWDPTLVAVLGAAVPISMLFYQLVDGWSFLSDKMTMKKPVCAAKFSVPTNTILDKNLVLGSAIFGCGWAVGLLCPGPALFAAAVGNKQVIFNWMPGFFAGSWAAMKYKERK